MNLQDSKELKTLSDIYSAIRSSPQSSFTVKMISERFVLSQQSAQQYLEYLGSLEREYEINPIFKGVSKIFIQGNTYYEALSDNTDIRRDYDFRAPSEGGRDLSPKNMFYYVWAWISLAEELFKNNGIVNNKVILINNDCRGYPSETIQASKDAARLRGYKVVFAYCDKNIPSCVSNYSHAVRMVHPCIAIFITASHISRPTELTVVGAKVSFVGKTGKLESLTTRMIKDDTARHLETLKASQRLCDLIQPLGTYEEVFGQQSHTRLAVTAVLASMGHLAGKTLYRVARDLEQSTDIDLYLRKSLPDSIPPVFKGLKVVIEGSHTSSGPLAYQAFQSLGAECTLLHGTVEEIRGPHKADPSIIDNLQELFASITSQNAHMGVAFDLDGDRGAVVLPDGKGGCSVIAPDKICQTLMPFLMKEGGYETVAKPEFVRCCLATDALVEQAQKSGVTLDTVNAGYVYLKKKERERKPEGYLAIAMGEASGHVWLDYTGAFENPIVVALLFAAMGILHAPKDNLTTKDSSMILKIFQKLEIPFRRAARFQPLFAESFIKQTAISVAKAEGKDTAGVLPVTQKVIGQCGSQSILRLKEFFVEGKVFTTPIGPLKVDKFEYQFDEDEQLYRFGKIYFSMDGISIGSFVSRYSSNDPTAVQVWEVREYGDVKWSGKKLPPETISKRFTTIGGLVLDSCEKMGVLEMTDRKPSVNMKEVLACLTAYRQLWIIEETA